MASLAFSSLCLIWNPVSLSSSYVVSDKLRIASPYIGFGTSKKNSKLGGLVCRATSVSFRNLDADDFRHPLDKQVMWYTRFPKDIWIYITYFVFISTQNLLFHTIMDLSFVEFLPIYRVYVLYISLLRIGWGINNTDTEILSSFHYQRECKF